MSDPEARPPLIRSDFSDDTAWRSLIALATAETNADGEPFVANIGVIDDPANERRDPESGPSGLSFWADAQALAQPDHPILVVDRSPDAGLRTFRVVVTQLWSVENNLSLANMDFAEFADNVDDDGVFRGFRGY